ncbi:MAG: hypothetical protein WBF84_00935 [Castellaniella sp.]|uniref:hypothetical protein n=1 Tax=Castellaniella sp. TaxID=1955812 RepID=UPI003C71314D
MIPNSTKAKILRSVADGATLSQAGTAAGISTARARTALGSLCRTLRQRADVEAIQAQPQKYLDALLAFEIKPQFELRKALVDKLEQALRLRSAAELTPQYLSNITASQLLECGVTLVAIAELQKWLYSHDLSLKRRPPKTESDLRETQRAIALLDAFHFDTDILKQQLANLVQEEDAEVNP